ncbi:DUF565 domain-containing protein [Leptolyngbya sp. BC1307]|uniref:DUF565 domain-containing protein n=1 Tax=Leptolyngbya sp. BC1307 TaxID=2029589 RepID=UPI000EFC3AEF|nr:DUF565 domain-containing protein [Leptolyngbya sp. BC1307]
MQRTRLNTLVNQTTLRFRQWVFNPWRRLALVVMSLLFGNFFATAISATAGQTARLDVVVAGVLVVFVELISWLYHRFTPRRRQAIRANQQVTSSAVISPLDDANALISPGLDPGPVRSRSTVVESLNAFKLGMVYGLFVEAFKLGS